MLRERQQSLEIEGGSGEPSPEEALSADCESTQALKLEVEDIAEEEEGEEDEDADGEEVPLNLCLGDEDLERVKRLNINCPGGGSSRPIPSPLSPLGTSPPQYAASGSFLRDQLLGGGLDPNIISMPIPNPYLTTRGRSASMSSVPLTAPPPCPGRGRWLDDSHLGAAVGGSLPGESLNQNHSPGTGAGGKKKLQCPDCGKEFSQLRNYRYHRSRHDGTSQFACTCPVCGKHFNDKGYLSSHLKIHRNAKEYQCEWCEKSFNQRVAYNMHVRIHS